MYGLIISLSIFAVVFLIEKEVKKAKKDTDMFWNGVFWTILIGIVGARIYHVLDYIHFYSSNPLQIFEIYKGGLGIYGAIVAATFYLLYNLKSRKEPILWWLDTIALYLPLGQTIGRIANISNKELLPVAYYEMAGTFLLFVGLYSLKKSTQKKEKIT